MLELLIPILCEATPSRRCQDAGMKAYILHGVPPGKADRHIIFARKFAVYYIIGISPVLTDCKNTEI